MTEIELKDLKIQEGVQLNELSVEDEVSVGEVGVGVETVVEKGEDGADGLSAYEIAVKNGFKGTETEWLASLKGKDGEQGVSAAAVIDIGNSYEEVEIVQHDTLSNIIKAKLPKMTGEQFKQAWEETLKGEKRVIFKWVEQVFTELPARYLSVVETCVFDNAEYPDRYYNLYVRGRFEQGDFVIRYCSDKDFKNVIIGEYWRNLTNIDRQVIVGEIDSNFSELYDRISMTYETLLRVNDEVWGGIGTNTDRISEAWGSINSNTTRVQKLEDKAIAFVDCSGDFKDGYGTLTKRQITDILYYFNTMKTTVVLQNVKEVGTSYCVVNEVTFADNIVSVTVFVKDDSPFLTLLKYSVNVSQAETDLVYPTVVRFSDYNNITQSFTAVHERLWIVETSKQDNLSFDGFYNAKTNPVATVQTVTDILAEIVANAPDDLNTIEELAAWIKSHPDDVAAMNAAIQENAAKIGSTRVKSVDLTGQDENGGNIYTITFEDDTTQTFTAPKGEKGDTGAQGIQGTAGKSVLYCTGTPTYDFESDYYTVGVNTVNGTPKQNDLLITKDGKLYRCVRFNTFYIYCDYLWSLKGADGADGANGLSAYEIAVKNGFKGTEAEWLDSLKGADGTGGSTTLFLHELRGAINSAESDYVLYFICNYSNKLDGTFLPSVFTDRVNYNLGETIVTFARFNNFQKEVIEAAQNGETTALLTFADGSTKQVDFSEDSIGDYIITALTGSTENENKMPVIRLHGIKDVDGTMVISEWNPLIVTVEIMSGALQVGDQLQLCAKSLYAGDGKPRRYRLRQFASYEITEEDLEKTHISVMMSNNLRRLFSGNKFYRYPKYVRLRRPVYSVGSANAYTAIFSNAEQFIAYGKVDRDEPNLAIERISIR